MNTMTALLILVIVILLVVVTVNHRRTQTWDYEPALLVIAFLIAVILVYMLASQGNPLSGGL